MKLLIAYASTEGQTEKIAGIAASELSGSGHEVETHNVSGLSGGLAVADFDKAIIAGSVHSGNHQKDLELYAFANRDHLNEMPTLFLSVSLAAAFEEHHQDAERYIETFNQATQWEPSEYALIAGAVKPDFYGWFEESTLMEGDLASHMNKELKEEHEFTDWDALKTVITEFAKG